MKNIHSLLALLAFALILVACGRQEAKSVLAETPTATKVSALPGAASSPRSQPIQVAPTPTRIPTPTPVPTPQWEAPTTLAEALQALRDALQNKDAETLARLMLSDVATGAYATDNTWHESAVTMAETLLKGVGDEPLRCTSFSEGMGGSGLELAGFRFPPQVPLPAWRVKDGSSFSHVKFSFEDEPPYRIVFVIPVPDELWGSGGEDSCDSPAAQIFGVAEGLSSGKVNCPNSPPPRLQVGQYAYVSVSPPVPNRVRNSPSKQGSVVGWAQPGRAMEVLEGPVCGNGWTWWRVRLVNTHLEGWTVEGDGGTYWLVPCARLLDCKSP